MSNTLRNVIIGCAVMAILGMIGIGACFVWVASQGAEPEDVEISVKGPASVATGESFTLQATVRNTAAKEQTLVSLDIADAYLDGIVIRGSEPPFKDAQHIPIDNTTSYSFDLPIPAGGEVTVVFEAHAAHPGDHRGDVDFCINSEISFLSYPVRTLVE